MEENLPENPVSESQKVAEKHVVIFGKHQYIVDNASNILTKGGYRTSAFVGVNEAMEHIKMNQTDAVFIGGGVDPHDRIALKELLDSTFPHVKLIDHFGGPATILSEVQGALK